MKYTIIKDQEQYDKYCEILEEIVLLSKDEYNDEIDLLSLLISEYNDRIMEEYQVELNPVELLKDLMKDNGLTQVDLSKKIDVSPQLLNDVIKYRREITKKLAFKLSAEFVLKYSAFLKPYRLNKSSQIFVTLNNVC